MDLFRVILLPSTGVWKYCRPFVRGEIDSQQNHFKMGESERVNARRAYKKAVENDALFRRAETFHKILMVGSKPLVSKLEGSMFNVG